MIKTSIIIFILSLVNITIIPSQELFKINDPQNPIGKMRKFFVAYTESWKSVDNLYNIALKYPGILTHVIISFAQPQLNGQIAQYWGDFGSGITLQNADKLVPYIALLQKLGINVSVSFGGATFPFGSTYDLNYMVNVAIALGVDGIDIDYEDGGGATTRSVATYYDLLWNLRAVINKSTNPNLMISIPAWPNGADAAGNNEYDLFTKYGRKPPINFVTVQTYNLGKDADPRKEYANYRNLLDPSIPVCFGIQIASQWQNVTPTYSCLPGMTNCQDVKGFGDYYNVNTFIDFVLNNYNNYIQQNNPQDGFMLWTIEDADTALSSPNIPPIIQLITQGINNSSIDFSQYVYNSNGITRANLQAVSPAQQNNRITQAPIALNNQALQKNIVQQNQIIAPIAQVKNNTVQNYITTVNPVNTPSNANTISATNNIYTVNGVNYRLNQPKNQISNSCSQFSYYKALSCSSKKPIPYGTDENGVYYDYDSPAQNADGSFNVVAKCGGSSSNITPGIPATNVTTVTPVTNVTNVVKPTPPVVTSAAGQPVMLGNVYMVNGLSYRLVSDTTQPMATSCSASPYYGVYPLSDSTKPVPYYTDKNGVYYDYYKDKNGNSVRGSASENYAYYVIAKCQGTPIA